jgi:hypothetical protein
MISVDAAETKCSSPAAARGKQTWAIVVVPTVPAVVAAAPLSGLAEAPAQDSGLPAVNDLAEAKSQRRRNGLQAEEAVAAATPWAFSPVERPTRLPHEATPAWAAAVVAEPALVAVVAVHAREAVAADVVVVVAVVVAAAAVVVVVDDVRISRSSTTSFFSATSTTALATIASHIMAATPPTWA